MIATAATAATAASAATVTFAFSDSNYDVGIGLAPSTTSMVGDFCILAAVA